MQQTEIDESAIKQQVISVIKKSEQDWNGGSIESFMESYLRSDSLRFASGGSVNYGWQPVLERYKQRYQDKAAMGHLTFSELHITVISADAALVFGRYTLERENDEPTGLFTLLFRKTGDGWRIVHDHTSSETN
jgi:ketosteroid isomerase-like protein